VNKIADKTRTTTPYANGKELFYLNADMNVQNFSWPTGNLNLTKEDDNRRKQKEEIRGI